MKKSSWLIGVVAISVLIFSYTRFYKNEESISPNEELPHTSDLPFSDGVRPITEKEALNLAASKTVDNEPAGRLTSSEQFQKIDTQLEALNLMIEDYENGLETPEERESHRQAMKEKLKIYSRDLLPIALETMKKEQSN